MLGSADARRTLPRLSGCSVTMRLTKPSAKGCLNGGKYGHAPSGAAVNKNWRMGRFLARANMKATLDVLLERVENLHLVDPESVKLTGAVLRGPREMQVAFDSVSAEPVAAPA